ncbi:MAG: hypothetical protein Q8R02_23935 [Hyphomonadaceae bacterium]|nr:hypothetical protein [Hyphomonadaceae bacterium]
MPRITLEKDNLDEQNKTFVQTPLKQALFLNSVPKSGTHLLRNIMRMFVPVEHHYTAAFIQIAQLRAHVAAFSPNPWKLSWGHLLFDDEPAVLMKDVRKVLLVRDPYDWVLARARFYLSENFDGRLEHLKGGRVNIEDILNMMIFGVHKKAPSLEETFRYNACAWLGTGVYLIRYEDLMQAVKSPDIPASERYMLDLFAACGIDAPTDWRERVRIGSDRKQSSTARENLRPTGVNVPDELPDTQKQLVDYAAPRLRKLLGYGPR